MKGDELMVGDWVRGFLPDTYSQVVGVLNEYRVAIIACGKGAYMELSVDDIQAVPLTAEILEKNGLHKSPFFNVWTECTERYELRVSRERVYVIFLAEDGGDEAEYSLPHPKYVHEFQHALRVLGIEKEIEL